MGVYLNDRVQAHSVCAGDYLAQVRRMENEITCKLVHIQCLRQQMPGGLRLDNVQAGSPADPTADRAVRIEELEQEVERLYEQMRLARSRIGHLVKRLPNPRTRCLLEMRYLSGLNWEDIAESLSVTPRSALRMHQKALRTIDILLSELRETT